MPINSTSNQTGADNPNSASGQAVAHKGVNPTDSDTNFVSRRGGDRIDCTHTIKISHPIFGERIVDSKDVSEEGVFLSLQESPIPPVGTLLTFEVLGGLPVQNKKTVKVVRSDANGIALRFIH